MDILILLTGLAAVACLFVFGERLKVMPVPTLPRVRIAAIDMLRDHARGAQRIAELGSGWGGMTARLAKAFPDAQIDAYELSWLPYLVSRVHFMGAKNIRVHRADIFKAGLSEADIVFCYLSPWHMRALEPKFKAELKEGATVLSVSFPLDRMPDIQKTVQSTIGVPVMLYRWRSSS